MGAALEPTAFRSARLDAGLTQAEVAQAAEITVGTVSRFERGLHRPHRLTAQRLAQVVGLCRGHADQIIDPEGPLRHAPNGGIADDGEAA